MSMVAFSQVIVNQTDEKKSSSGDELASNEPATRPRRLEHAEELQFIKHLKDFQLGRRIIEKNPTCCDCNAQNPSWALISHGVLIWYVFLFLIDPNLH